MSTIIREATVIAALIFLATTHPALAEKAGTPTNSVGQGAGHATSDGGSKGGAGGDAKGTPAPIAGLGIGALLALSYFARKLQARRFQGHDM